MDMDRSIIRYEIARQAWERRRPLWAAVLSAGVRLKDVGRKEVQQAIEEELKKLVAESLVYVFRVPRFWGSEQRIERDELEHVLKDERVWHPRAMSVAKLPRLGLTDAGFDAYHSSRFGNPSPIVWVPDWFDLRTVERAEDLNEKQLAYVASGTLAGCAVYGAIAGTGWAPGIASMLHWIFPYGTGILVFAILGLIAGALIGKAKSSRQDPEWEFDPHIPVRAMDEVGDARF
jgi:hypothetical protein